MNEPPKATNFDRIGEPDRCDACGDELEVVDVDLPTDGFPKVFYGPCKACKEWGEPCDNGNRGQMKFGDPRDCRCPDCLSDACDNASLLMED